MKTVLKISPIVLIISVLIAYNAWRIGFEDKYVENFIIQIENSPKLDKNFIELYKEIAEIEGISYCPCRRAVVANMPNNSIKTILNIISKGSLIFKLKFEVEEKQCLSFYLTNFNSYYGGKKGIEAMAQNTFGKNINDLSNDEIISLIYETMNIKHRAKKNSINTMIDLKHELKNPEKEMSVYE